MLLWNKYKGVAGESRLACCRIMVLERRMGRWPQNVTRDVSRASLVIVRHDGLSNKWSSARAYRVCRRTAFKLLPPPPRPPPAPRFMVFPLRRTLALFINIFLNIPYHNHTSSPSAFLSVIAPNDHYGLTLNGRFIWIYYHSCLWLHEFIYSIVKVLIFLSQRATWNRITTQRPIWNKLTQLHKDISGIN